METWRNDNNILIMQFLMCVVEEREQNKSQREQLLVS